MKIILPVLALSACVAGAQSTISPADRYAWGTNFGWISFLPSPADGVIVQETCLAGRAWSANFGWMDFGDGSPANAHTYTNSSATDYGVNLSPDGRLTGNAWMPNAGWVFFEQTHGQPRIDLLTGAFHGHAWCPNAGWIVLDTALTSVRTTSITIADTDNDGLGDSWEMQHFANLTAANAATNADNDPASDLDEYRAGTAPRDAANWLQLVSQALTPGGTAMTLRFTTAPARLYRIESSTSLDGTWTTASPGTFAPDAGGVTEKVCTFPAGTRRFFRVISIRTLM